MRTTSDRSRHLDGFKGRHARFSMMILRRDGSGRMRSLCGVHCFNGIKLAPSWGDIEGGGILVLAALWLSSRSSSTDSLEHALDVVSHQVSTLMVLDDVLPKSIDIVLGRNVAFDLALHGGIPMVLNGVIRPTGQQLRDLSPLVTKSLVVGDNKSILLLAPRLLTNGGIEVIVPTLAALLTDASRELGGNLTPALGTMSLDKFHNLLILLLAPGSLESTGLLTPTDTCHLVVPAHTFGRLAVGAK
mmetsp:Transcript_21645/g.47205  ORF Transcript_21645/g.47205 Transcript_21645/m.47205 type:complete len:245 (-) Transcript_21645:1885-2619(-)